MPGKPCGGLRRYSIPVPVRRRKHGRKGKTDTDLEEGKPAKRGSPSASGLGEKDRSLLLLLADSRYEDPLGHLQCEDPEGGG